MNEAPFPKPAEILRYYQLAGSALDALFDAARTAPSRIVSNQEEFEVRIGGAPLWNPDRLRWLSIRELDALQAEVQSELEQEVVLALVASAEAILQTDFASRVANGSDLDPVAKKMKGLAAARDRKRRVEVREILDIWKEPTARTTLIGKFNQLHAFRHWLAHGRYWKQPSSIDSDVRNAWTIIRELFAALPGIEPLEVIDGAT